MGWLGGEKHSKEQTNTALEHTSQLNVRRKSRKNEKQNGTKERLDPSMKIFEEAVIMTAMAIMMRLH